MERAAIEPSKEPQTFMSADNSISFAAVCNFDKFDKNGNGYISKSEIDTAVTSGNHTGEAARILGGLKLSYDELRGVSNDEWGRETSGISRQDLLGSPAGGAVENSARRGFDRVSAVQGNARELYPEGANKALAPEGVNQGYAGDCYFLAAVAAMTTSAGGRRSIQDMIADNHNGTYSVKFPGAEYAVTVPAPTEAELGLYNHGGKNGTWSAVLEKAFGQMTNESLWLSPLTATGVPVEAVANGGRTSEALSLLTGKNALSYELAATGEDKLHTVLSRGTSDSFVGTASRMGDAKSVEGLPSGHAYTIVGYNAEKRTVTLRNPWGFMEPAGASGKGDGKNDGAFELTLKQFRDSFQQMDLARPMSR